MDSESASSSTKNPNDGIIALGILVVSVIAAIGVLAYFWRSSKKSSPIQSNKSEGTLKPPAERQEYLDAKQKLDPNNPAQVDELKRLLMKRALKTIPIVLSLQNEGSSIERLYKKGMLTDDMHFRVKELKAFVDQEFQDVQFEAEDLVEGWGQNIWPQAMQFHQMVQRQTGGTPEDKKAAEEEKKKADALKKKEKEKAKKLEKAQEKNEKVVEPLAQQQPPVSSSSSGKKESVPKSSSSSSSSMPSAIDAKALEAERNAKKLLEEEELEKAKNSKRKPGTIPFNKRR